MLQAQPALETARIFAAVLILSALALALYALVTLAERLLVPWQPGGPPCVEAIVVAARARVAALVLRRRSPADST